MKVILLNNNPAVSKLVSVSLNKLEFEFVEIDNLESLEFYDKNTPRSGRFSVYTNKNTCVNDSYNSGKGSVATATIAYAYSALSTNKTNF